MKWELDLDADSIYIFVTEELVASQQEMPDGVVVDLDENGDVRGVEVVSVSAGWSAEHVIARFGLSDVDADSLRYLAKTAPPRYRLKVGTGTDATPADIMSVDESIDVRVQTLAPA